MLTKDNTTLSNWWKAANVAFADVGMREPRFGEANDHYKMGESPETFRDWILFGEGRDSWNAIETLVTK